MACCVLLAKKQFRRLNMHRSQLRILLENYHPVDGDEKISKKKMLEFLEGVPNCFERGCKQGHFTGSSWLLNKEGDKALLLLHGKFNEWLQPGGHCDGDSDVFRVALREAQEESGIMGIKPVSEAIFDIDVHRIPPYKNDPEHYHYDVRFLLQVQSDESLIKSSESHDLQWFDKDKEKLPNQVKEIARMFNKWVSRPCQTDAFVEY